MPRLRSLGRTVRRLLARPSRAVASILRPVVAAVGAFAGAVARILGPIAVPARAVGRPLKGLFGDLAGLIPALIAGAGVFLVVAGLFNYFAPAAVQPGPSPSEIAAYDTPPPYSLPPRATPASSGSGLLSAGPSGTASLAVATRVVIRALTIDNAIVRSPQNEQYPLCNVAEYLSLGTTDYAYPGAPQAVYLYAHARVGMFWNLLVNSKVKSGAAMLGDLVEIYTDDNQDHIYEITKVIPHVPNDTAFADQALAATTDQLWLQTSEGHLNSSTKLQVVATPVGVVAATQADAHPTARGNVCPDAPRCTAAGQGGCRR